MISVEIFLVQLFKHVHVSLIAGVMWVFAGLVELPTIASGFTAEACTYLQKQLEPAPVLEKPKKIENKSAPATKEESK